MMRFLSLMLAFILLCATPPQVQAQTQEQPFDAIAQRDYEKMADQIFHKEWGGHIPKGMNFMNLRRLYTQTQFYDPLATQSIEWMNELVEQIKTTNSDQRRQRLLKIYHLMLRDQAANFAIITEAWKLAKVDAIYGNADFLNDLRISLFNTVIRSGNGESYQRAYDVVTLEEESTLLKFLGYTVLDTLSLQKGIFHYNIHSVKDNAGNGPFEVYVNTTFPIRHLIKKKEREAPKVDIEKR